MLKHPFAQTGALVSGLSDSPQKVIGRLDDVHLELAANAEFRCMGLLA